MNVKKQELNRVMDTIEWLKQENADVLYKEVSELKKLTTKIQTDLIFRRNKKNAA